MVVYRHVDMTTILMRLGEKHKKLISEIAWFTALSDAGVHLVGRPDQSELEIGDVPQSCRRWHRATNSTDE